MSNDKLDSFRSENTDKDEEVEVCHPLGKPSLIKKYFNKYQQAYFSVESMPELNEECEQLQNEINKRLPYVENDMILSLIVRSSENFEAT